MNRHIVLKAIIALFLTAAVLLWFAFSCAYASPGGWMLPWTALDHSYLSHVLVDASDVTAVKSKADIGVEGIKYTGYWHGLHFKPDSMLRYGIGLIAPAGGTVLYSTQWSLEVMTGDGALYELSIYDNESSMTVFSVGDTLRAGDPVGDLSLMTQSPALNFEYLVPQEPDTLFGLAREWFVNGTDLKDLNCNLYSGPVLPDLIPGTITISGTESPNYNGVNADVVWEPNSWLLFDTGITNLSSQGTENNFNIKWFVNGTEVGYGAHEAVPGYTSLTEGNSFLWHSFEPGNYLVQFWVDCDDYVRESNDTNNIAETYIVVGY